VALPFVAKMVEAMGEPGGSMLALPSAYQGGFLRPDAAGAEARSAPLSTNRHCPQSEKPDGKPLAIGSLTGYYPERSGARGRRGGFRKGNACGGLRDNPKSHQMCGVVQDKNWTDGGCKSPLPSPSPSAIRTMSQPIADRTPRREFLKLLLLAGGAAGAVAMPDEGLAQRRRKTFRGEIVFRLQTRRHYSRKACKQHHRFTIFRSHALADANRAHPGCNCPIVTQMMPVKQFKRAFGRSALAPAGVIDVRRTPLSRRRRRGR
jgi:hypothetical protein